MWHLSHAFTDDKLNPNNSPTFDPNNVNLLLKAFFFLFVLSTLSFSQSVVSGASAGLVSVSSKTNAMQMQHSSLSLPKDDISRYGCKYS